MDFVSDALANGKRIKILVIVDDFTKESVDLVADFGIGDRYVTKVLDRAAQFRGLPHAIRINQGPEFTTKAMDHRASKKEIALKRIDPASRTRTSFSKTSTAGFETKA